GRNRRTHINGDFAHAFGRPRGQNRSEEHTSELQSPCNIVCRLLLEKKTAAAVRRMWTPFPETWVANEIAARVGLGSVAAYLFFLMIRGPPRSTRFPSTSLSR